MTDKRKIRLIVSCEGDYNIVWLKGAHITDEKEIIAYLNNHKYFKGDDPVTGVDIENHGYCRKIHREKCDDPSKWECSGKIAWYDCSKNDKGAVPYTMIYFNQEKQQQGEE
jgi:hypothetical protein